MVVRDLLEYAVAVIVFQLVSIGIPGFVLAWRVGSGRPWLALAPVLMFAKITDCGHQGLRQKVINGVVLGLVFPVALAVPASLNAGEAAPYDTGTTSEEVYWGLASTVSLVVCLGVWMAMWDGVCRATGQNGRKVWLFFVPLVNFAMPWVIALQAKRLVRSGVELVPQRSSEAPPRAPTQLAEPRPAQSSRGDQSAPRRRSWRRPTLGVRRRPPVWLLSNFVLVALFGVFLLFGGTGIGSGFRQQSAPVPTSVPATPTPEPDRVVGVVERCDAVNERALARLARDGCTAMAAAFPQAVMNHRLEVTVRTFSGAVYVVEVSPSAGVSLGDVWPPKR